MILRAGRSFHEAAQASEIEAANAVRAETIPFAPQHRLQHDRDAGRQHRGHIYVSCAVTTDMPHVVKLFVASLVSLSLAAPALAQSAWWQLTDGALVHPEYRGLLPKGSDVIFSTRTKRDDSIEFIRAFGATRVEWVYSVDAEFIKAVKATAGWFGGALGANMPLPTEDGLARDFDGKPMIAPWMKGAGSPWLTTTHPDTVKSLKERAARIIVAGADSLQIDDPTLQLRSVSWGGDFNKATLQGFSRYLEQYPDRNAVLALGLSGISGSDYREFLRSRYGIKDTKDYLARYRQLPTTSLWVKYLRSTVRQYFADFRSHLNAQRGKPFPLSMNLGILERPSENILDFSLTEFADYAIAETAIASVEELIIRAATFRALGVGYVPSLKPRTLAENRVAIATFYALGAQPLVPWDVYVAHDERGQVQRFYGSVQDYGFLYAFVKKFPHLFDHTEPAAVVGIPVPVDKFRNPDTMQLIHRLVSRQVPFAFVLMGGAERRFRINIEKTKRFKMLIMVNPETDFTPDDLQALRSISIPRVHAQQVADATLRDLSPFTVIGGVGALKVYPRASPKDGGHKLLVHLVDESRGGQPAGVSDCTRRIGLKKNAVPGRRLIKATWHSDAGALSLPVSEGERESAVTISECRLWGILSLDLQ